LLSRSCSRYRLLARNPHFCIVTHETNEEQSSAELDIFISHSSRDTEIAKRLITLMRSALNLASPSIRCTSVDGFRLPAGTPIEERLRREIHDSKVFIGLITSSALDSVYVLFELGARWGTGKRMIPLLVHGSDSQLLKGPLAVLNALSCDNRSQLHQFVEDLAAVLGKKPDRPSAYEKCVNELLEEISRLAEQAAKAAPAAEPCGKPRIKWGCYEFAGEEGLFCTACYDTKRQKVLTTRANSRFRMCPVCKAVFGA
jgi:hypothetical protein